MTTTPNHEQTWDAADLRQALYSPDITIDAKIVLDIDFGEDRVRTRFFRLDVSDDGKTVTLRAIQ